MLLLLEFSVGGRQCAVEGQQCGIGDDAVPADIELSRIVNLCTELEH